MTKERAEKIIYELQRLERFCLNNKPDSVEYYLCIYVQEIVQELKKGAEQ